MNILSVSIIAMAAVTFYVGFYHLFIFYRCRFRYRIDLIFALTCFAMGLFDILCAKIYHVSSLTEGFFYQRAQVATLTLIGAAYIWFITEYISVESKKVRNFFSFYFIFAAIIVFLDKSKLSWHIDKPAIKNVILPLNLDVTYYEVVPGLFTNILSLMGILVFIYGFWIGILYYKKRNKSKAKTLIFSTSIFFAGLCNDVAVHIQLYNFIYLIEFAYMGIVLLMANSLSNEVVESAVMKEALQESEKKYRELVDNSPVAIFITQNHLLKFYNQRFIKIFGYTEPDPLIDDHFNKLVLPEYWSLIDKEVKSLESGQKDVANYNFKGIKKDGTIIYIENLSMRIIYKGQPAIQGTMIDITERKRAEEERKNLLIELKEKNIELEEILFIASHDLKEPQRMVVSYMQLLEQRYKDKLGPDADEFIKYAIQSTKKMRLLINGLLKYSEITTKGKSFKKVDCNVIFKKAIHSLKEVIEENRAIITCHHLPTVFADSNQLIQLFYNLIMNAIMFKKKDPPYITINVIKEDSKWLFSIKDNGIGIESRYLKQIFTIYKKFHKNRNNDGAGIGLSVCRKIVERHRGKIWVKSKPDKGSIFYFTLPVM
jgi:PAS domain S-box-containing protein